MSQTSEDLSEVWQGQIEASFKFSGDEFFYSGMYMAICMHGQEVLARDHARSKTWQRESTGLAHFDKEHSFS